MCVLLMITALSGCIVENPTPADRFTSRPALPTPPPVVMRYGPTAAHTLDVYRPAGWSQSDRRPVLVFIHGGSWMSGDRSLVSQPLLAQSHRGWVVLSADYRLVPAVSWPAQSYDVDRLLRWVRRNSANLGIDPARVVVSGHSAGAHLALLSALAPGRFVDPELPPDLRLHSPRPDGVVSLAAPVDLSTLSFEIFGLRSELLLDMVFGCNSPQRCVSVPLLEASPLHHVSPDDPPAFIAHGIDDPIVPVSQALSLYRSLSLAAPSSYPNLDIVDFERIGATSRYLHESTRGHIIDTGLNLTALEIFLDRVGS